MCRRQQFAFLIISCVHTLYQCDPFVSIPPRPQPLFPGQRAEHSFLSTAPRFEKPHAARAGSRGSASTPGPGAYGTLGLAAVIKIQPLRKIRAPNHSQIIIWGT